MKNHFKKITVGIITTTLITTSFSYISNAFETKTTNAIQKENENNTTVFEGRFPTISKLKNSKGDVVVLPSKNETQNANMLRQSNSSISNAKRYTKTYRLYTIAAGGGSAKTLVGVIRQA
ncbi:hypothetical protein GLV96_00495 [Staphylococcus agnetis]|uniref:hypothetical protein n=1 Tax=Staphylococcus agnetis TaxID=985762 RepID=UPI00142F4794|nr:hypothetical protein [Staphylococcus agnetis]NJH85041.1 hypothetical protein [Staphylococcus agnetis]NJI16913.1 hypothetical protein [Staphylococcus agnetis]NJI16946.1 hypothetical protein [Staphylococcus agnetis]